MAGRVPAAFRGEPGGIAALADAIDAHRGAFEYDWRARFHLPLTEVGESMTYGEAWRLFLLLSADPSSHVAAAMNGWSFPASREALALFDLFDLQHASKAKRRPAPYQRPWVANERKRRGRGMPLEELKAVLAATRASGSSDAGESP